MKILLYTASLFLLPLSVSAATLTLVPEPAAVAPGQLIKVEVAISSLSPVNAFSGTLSIPAGWHVEGASDGGSIVSAWIEPPAAGEGGITFAGVTAGGFAGEHGTLFSALLRAGEQPGVVALSNVSVLRADGAGTREPVVSEPLYLSPASGAGWSPPTDTDAPEPFDPAVARVDEWEAAFAAVDKGSGIDRFEVAETRVPLWLAAPVWHAAKSPYVFTDQYRTSDVYIRAIDRAGNARTAVVHRAAVLRPQELAIGCILIVCALLAYLLFLRRSSFLR